MTLNISILGAGAWGTALARLFAERHQIMLWSHREDLAQELQTTRFNSKYLAGFELPEPVTATSDLERALAGAHLLIAAMPTPHLREVLGKVQHLNVEARPLVIAAKGIEVGSLMLPSQIAEDVLDNAWSRTVAVLSGPSFALEVAQGLPTNVVAAAPDHELSVEIQQVLSTDRFRIYSSDDPVGVQVGGALKNVIAVAAGACDGLGFGHNTRAAVITRGIAEVARLALALGGQALTLAGLAGLGDLVLTSTGSLSRNRTVGFEMAQGHSLEKVLRNLGHVAEGVTTAKSAYDLALKLNVDLPICTEVYRVIYEEKPVASAVRDVLSRPLKKEWQ